MKSTTLHKPMLVAEKGKLVDHRPHLPNESDTKVRVRITRVKEFGSPEDAFKYARRMEGQAKKIDTDMNEEMSVKVIRKSPIADLSMTKVIIMQHMQKQPRETVFTRQDFLEQFDRWQYANRSINTLLSNLAKSGHIVRVGYGKYMLSE